MYAEELSGFFMNQGMSTMRAYQFDRSCSGFIGRKSLAADFTLILDVPTVVVVYKLVWGIAYKTDDIFGDGVAILALDWSGLRGSIISTSSIPVETASLVCGMF